MAGCLPSRITLDLAPQTGKLKETVVAGTNNGPKVVLIDVTGLISEQPVGSLIKSHASVVDSFVAQLEKAAADPRVRAVVLRINSPGGTVAATETVYEEILRFRERTGKPVVASFAEIAASGGYYIALACDEIIAQPSTITGSIGVIMQTFNVSRGMSMIGIEGRAVTSKRNKDIANPFAKIDEQHYAILQGIVDEFYAAFRGRVLDARPISSENEELVTDGRVFTGTEAVRLGLADRTGGVRDAFDVAKERANVSNASLVKYHRDGAVLRTPYARAHADLPSANESTGPFDWFSNQLPPLRPGAYYLWSAGSVR